MAKNHTGTNTSTVIHLRKLDAVACDCAKCINWLGSKKGCRLHIQNRIKNGKCRHYGTYETNGYTVSKEERATIIEHNKAVDAARAAAKAAGPATVTLEALCKACNCDITMDYLRHCKTRRHPGNARYEIMCITEDPLTIRIKGLRGARKTYIVKE